MSAAAAAQTQTPIIIYKGSSRPIIIKSDAEEPRPILISLEGNIGAGKTTIIKRLKELYPNWHFIDEPVDVWTSLKTEEGDNLLELFYHDKKRWSYTFQNCAVLMRMQLISGAINKWKDECARDPSLIANNVFVTERSIETDYNVFASMLREDRCINDIEWTLYLRWYNTLKTSCSVSGIVYVDTPVDVCMDRIRERGRIGEDSISKEYMESLDRFHREWMGRKEHPFVPYHNYGEVQDLPENIGVFVKRLGSA
jgi:deoxyadenosine/deoxycytidine kinase